jgi:hypothetical protein
VIEASVQTDAHRREVQIMQRTIAEEMQAKGRQEGALRAQQRTLMRLLRRRFGDVPEAIATVVNTCSDDQQLDAWLDNFATARSLQGVDINGS